jgi:hypothetical protein
MQPVGGNVRQPNATPYRVRNQEPARGPETCRFTGTQTFATQAVANADSLPEKPASLRAPPDPVTGRWWAHLVGTAFTRINIAPTILRKKIEDMYFACVLFFLLRASFRKS